MNSLSVLGPAALALALGFAKIGVAALNYWRIRQRRRPTAAAKAEFSLEIGIEEKISDPTLEQVTYAVDRLGQSDRLPFLVLAQSSEHYVQADPAGPELFSVQARLREGRTTRQLAARKQSIMSPDGALLQREDVKAIFARFCADRTLDPAYRWRDITGEFRTVGRPA